jgi:cytochrome c-type biogenesis protein CcmF
MEAAGRAEPAARRVDRPLRLLNFVERVQATRAGQSFLTAACAAAQLLRHASGAPRRRRVRRRRAMVSGYQAEKDVKMESATRSAVGGYTFRFNGVRRKGPNYVALVGDVDL